MSFLGPDALFRSMIRETARATHTMTQRKITVVQDVGATVTAAVPGTGKISVHVDGDPVGQSEEIACATWELFDVGQRVLVQFFPPSGVVLLGPTGPPAPWTAYTPVWSGSGTRTPTVRAHTNVYHLSSAESASFVAPAVATVLGDVVIVRVSVIHKTSAPAVTGVTSSPPLSWTKAITQSANDSGAIDGTTRNIVNELWWAPCATALPALVVTATIDRAVHGNAEVTVWKDAVATGPIGATHSDTLTSSAPGSVAFSSVTVPTGTNSAFTSTGAVVGSDNGPITVNGQPVDLAVTVDSGAATTTQADENTTNGLGDFWDTARVLAYGNANSGLHVVRDANATSSIFGAQIKAEILGVPDAPILAAGILAGYYRLIGKTLHLRVHVVGGAGDTYGSGNYTLSLPPGLVASGTPAGGEQIIGGGMRPAGTNHYRIAGRVLAGAAIIDQVWFSDAATTPWSAASPVAFTTAGKLTLEGVLEVA